MKYFLIALITCLNLISCKEEGKDLPEQKEEVPVLKADQKYRPLLHLFTSTNCGGCGRFGIPVFTDVAASMGDSILPLPTHFKYEDPFINNSSLAIEKGVVKHYSSPQIWVNMEEITNQIIPYSLEVAKEKTRQFLRDAMQTKAEVYLGLRAKLKDNGRFHVELALQQSAQAEGVYYYEVYGMEDGVVASQAGANPYVATHERVNRGGHFGGIGKMMKAEPGSAAMEELEYVPCVSCTTKQMYFYAIVWKEVGPGKYAYVNGIVFKGG